MIETQTLHPPALFAEPAKPQRDTYLQVPMTLAERKLVHDLADKRGEPAARFVRSLISDYIERQADRKAAA